MKKSLLSLALLALTGMGAANAANPDLWIRGGNFGWNGSDCKEVNHFTENNGVYTLTVETLTGNFKIATKTTSGGWDDNYNYGGPTGGLKVELDKEYTLTNGSGSKDMTPVGSWSNVTLTFDINTLKLKVTGTAGEDVITYAIHGQFMKDTWDDITLKDDDNDGIWVSEAFTPTVLTGSFGAKQYTNGSQTKWYNGTTAQNLTAGGSVTVAADGGTNPTYTCEAGKQYVLSFNVNALTISMTEQGGEITYPEKMYLIGNVNGADWAADNVVELAKAEGEDAVYTGEALMGNSMLSGFGYFSFCTNKGTSATDWNAIVPRYGATASDFEPEFTDKVATCDIQGAENSFKVTADKTYGFSLDLKNMKVTITDKTEAPQPTTATIVYGDYTTYTPNAADYTWDVDNGAKTNKMVEVNGVAFKAGNVTFTGAQAGAGTPCRLYRTGDTENTTTFRLYKEGKNSTDGPSTWTIAAEGNYKITSIEITCNNSYAPVLAAEQPGATKFDNTTKVLTWTAPADDSEVKTVVFNGQANNGSTIAIKQAKVVMDVASGIENVYDVEDADAPVYYYNLQGVRVENPNNGIFIRVQGKKATKVMF